ncbi:Flagellar hook-basal body complex protein FliE OS=Ureibacillus acetophenoni OX=614649 GN=fliE PE=3 SV=1 [Ureibacillus acetophenoni]
MAINSISLLNPTRITNQTNKLTVQPTPYDAAKFCEFLKSGDTIGK